MELDIITKFGKIILEPRFWAGIIMIIPFAYSIKVLMKGVRKRENWGLSEKNNIKKEEVEQAFEAYKKTPKSLVVLGYLEIVVHYFAIWFSFYQLIVVWLSFKLGSKWNAWSTIAKVPDHLQDVDGFDYLELKNKTASLTLQRWLLGNIANILAAILSVFFGFVLVELFCLFQKNICM